MQLMPQVSKLAHDIMWPLLKNTGLKQENSWPELNFHMCRIYCSRQDVAEKCSNTFHWLVKLPGITDGIMWWKVPHKQCNSAEHLHQVLPPLTNNWPGTALGLQPLPSTKPHRTTSRPVSLKAHITQNTNLSESDIIISFCLLSPDRLHLNPELQVHTVTHTQTDRHTPTHSLCLRQRCKPQSDTSVVPLQHCVSVSEKCVKACWSNSYETGWTAKINKYERVEQCV